MKKILLLILNIVILSINGYGQGSIQNPINIGTITGFFDYSDTRDVPVGGPVMYYYKFTLSKSMDINISHCGSTARETTLTLFNSSGSQIAYNDGDLWGQRCDRIRVAALETINLGSGTYYICTIANGGGKAITRVQTTIPGENPVGNNFSDPIQLGTKTGTFMYSDTKSTLAYTNDYGDTGRDVFYKFTLASYMQVVISSSGNTTGGGIVGGTGSAGKVYLLDQQKKLINSSNTIINTDLFSGTYYVISEYPTVCNLTTQISGYRKSGTVDPGLSLSANRNYIFTVTPTTEISDANNITIGKSIQKVEYFDGLGRPLETIQRGFNPAGRDLVTYQEYDEFGRNSRIWLPSLGNKGSFKSLSEVTSSAISLNNDSKPYSQFMYENSPLNRLLKEYGAGQEWYTSGKCTRTDYLSNNSEYICKLYKTTDNTQIIKISQNGDYSDAELYITKTQDENNNISYEFKDKQGMIVLTRQLNGTIPYDTYYIYDSYGNLRVVLPPLAADKLVNGEWDDNDDILKKYAYMYKYDDRNRCIAKKLPGTEWTQYIYDKADRLILTQDGEQKKRKEWSFSLPDDLNRIVLNGTCDNFPEDTLTLLKNRIIKASRTNDKDIYKGYSISGITLPGTPVILSVNYYDNYDFMDKNGVPADTNSDSKFETISGYGTQYTKSHKGLLTGTLSFTLDTNEQPIYTIMYYDYRGRLIQSKSNNHLGGIEKLYTRYNFSGQPLNKMLVHTHENGKRQTEYYVYSYDHAGRLVEAKHKLNDAKEYTLLAGNTYDDLGRLKKTIRNGCMDMEEEHTYNVRSWLSSKTGTQFNEHLTHQFGGNIQTMQWTHASQTRKYTFSYDSLSRMKTASYIGVGNEKYNTSYAYDKHGNITSLQRYGRIAAGTGITSFGIVDKLKMDYAGNQLINVTETGPNVSLKESNDFKKKTGITTPHYEYNENGALKKDSHKSIADITYNLLNLPSQFTVNGVLNKYTYLSDGSKLKVEQGNFKRDYVGNKIYENSSLKQILIDGGYIENNKYHFYFTDHLGNVRSVVDDDGNIIQQSHYYPFGMTFAETSDADQNKQPYLYNGKELDRKNGLNLYDYGARFMDPVLGRFMTIDPLAEKYYSMSPYGYCGNNPVRFIDPDGKQIGIPPSALPLHMIPPPPYIQQKIDNPPTVEQIGKDIGEVISSMVEKIKDSLKLTATIFGLPIINTITNTETSTTNDKDIVKEATDSSKNEKHGDGGRSLGKGEKQIKDLESQLQEAKSKKEKIEIKRKIRRIRENGEKQKKGEEHGRANKR